jgi:hypothetical protein
MSLKFRLLLSTLLLLLFVSPAFSQLRYGFKTGLNFARMDGPSEVDAAGASLENWTNVTGFHIGAAFSYAFTDNFGARAELLYSKKGGKYTYEGAGYRFFAKPNSTVVRTNGNNRYLLNVSNSYLDLPLYGYAKFGDFEVQAGAYAALLIQTGAEGSLRYTGAKTVPLGNAVADAEFNLDYNYRKDAPGEGIGAQTVRVLIDNQNVDVPKTLGAYYDFPEDRGSLYNSIDFGLIGGVSYYLSRSLYINARLQYGLSDLTRTEADLNRNKTGDNNALILNADKDKNFTIQASVGFSF